MGVFSVRAAIGCVGYFLSVALGAQALPPGSKVTITALTQLAPTLPQFTRIDIPMLREAVPKTSGGRVEINLKSYPEMNVQGPEVIRHLYTLVASWGISGYMVNLAWWNRLDPQVRTFLERTFQEVEGAQWKLGAELTQDGIECNVGNVGNAAARKIFSVVKSRPMTLVKASDADNARARQTLTETVLPNWVKRCGAHCGDAFNELIAPISGVRYRAP